MSSLLAERGPIHVHVGATIIVRASRPPSDELVEHVEARLALIPRFRQRITSVGTMALINPVWADDPRFDISRHVRRVALPSPGGMAELRELVGRVMSEPLDLDAAAVAAVPGRGPGGRPPRLRQQDPPRARRRGRGDRRRHDHPRRDRGRPPRSRSARSAGSPTSRAPSCCSSAMRPTGSARPLRVARKAAREALTMPRSTAGRVMRTAEGFAKLAASGPTAPRDLPQPGDRPRPPGRLRRHRARAAQVDPRELRGDRQRRHPLGRRGGAAAAVRAPRRGVARAPGRRWCR